MLLFSDNLYKGIGPYQCRQVRTWLANWWTGGHLHSRPVLNGYVRLMEILYQSYINPQLITHARHYTAIEFRPTITVPIRGNSSSTKFICRHMTEFQESQKFPVIPARGSHDLYLHVHFDVLQLHSSVLKVHLASGLVQAAVHI